MWFWEPLETVGEGADPALPAVALQIWKHGVYGMRVQVCMRVRAWAMCCVWRLEDFGCHALGPQPLSTGLSLTWRSLIYINSFYIGMIFYGYIILK